MKKLKCSLCGRNFVANDGEKPVCPTCGNKDYIKDLGEQELPEELKTDNVDAELKDGVLTVRLPKLEPKPEQKVRKVQIK